MTYKKRNISKFKCKGIDLYERYDRVMNFMRRISGIGTIEKKIALHKYFIDKYKDSKEYHWDYEWSKRCVKEAIQNYDSAKEKQITLTHQVLKDMSEGIITNITQGIWLSYPHVKYDYYFDEYKNKYFTIKLNTGEEFLCRQKWKEYSDRRGRYDFYNQKWITKNPIIKHYYLKTQIIKKLN